MTYILGINSAYHESSACLLKNGKIIAFVEEERFNRIKHAKPAKIDNSDELPINAINFCLSEGKIELREVDYIGYSFFPEDRLEKGVGKDNLKKLPRGSWGTPEGEKLFYNKNMSVPKNYYQTKFHLKIFVIKKYTIFIQKYEFFFLTVFITLFYYSPHFVTNLKKKS